MNNRSGSLLLFSKPFFVVHCLGRALYSLLMFPLAAIENGFQDPSCSLGTSLVGMVFSRARRTVCNRKRTKKSDATVTL